jgi:hypothetical protein
MEIAPESVCPEAAGIGVNVLPSVSPKTAAANAAKALWKNRPAWRV